MDTFIKYLQHITPLSKSAIQDIEACYTRLELPKKYLLIPELSKSNALYFIEKGVARAFFMHKGKEVTDWFGMENMIIGPIIRNFPVKDSRHSVELLEDAVLYSVSFADLESLYQQHHDIERLGRMIAIQSILHLQYKIDSLQLLSARERYEDFIQRYPSLINRVPLGYISSFLGMNQVTLSRIRNPK